MSKKDKNYTTPTAPVEDLPPPKPLPEYNRFTPWVLERSSIMQESQKQPKKETAVSSEKVTIENSIPSLKSKYSLNKAQLQEKVEETFPNGVPSDLHVVVADILAADTLPAAQQLSAIQEVAKRVDQYAPRSSRSSVQDLHFYVYPSGRLQRSMDSENVGIILKTKPQRKFVEFKKFQATFENIQSPLASLSASAEVTRDFLQMLMEEASRQDRWNIIIPSNGIKINGSDCNIIIPGNNAVASCEIEYSMSVGFLSKEEFSYIKPPYNGVSHAQMADILIHNLITNGVAVTQHLPFSS